MVRRFRRWPQIEYKRLREGMAEPLGPSSFFSSAEICAICGQSYVVFRSVGTLANRAMERPGQHARIGEEMKHLLRPFLYSKSVKICAICG